MKYPKKEKLIPLLSTALCVTILLSVWSAAIFNGGKAILEEENRAAAVFPSPSADSLLDGNFFSELSLFISDSFPARSSLCALNSYARILIGARECNGIFLCDGAYLIKRGEYESLDTAKNNLSALSALGESIDNANFAIIPRGCDIYSKKLPTIYDKTRSDEINTLISDMLPQTSALRQALFDALSATDNAFYRTDHHWTTEGAYSAYRAIAPCLGVEALPREAFTAETVSESFIGTLASSSAFRFTPPDTVELYRFEGDNAYTVQPEGSECELSSFYCISALEKKDKYQVFLGGNYPFAKIREEGAQQKPKLLIVKDSFANSIIPFLAIHFDIDIVDPRYSSLPLSQMTDTQSYDRILFLFGADTLATTAMYKKLR